MYRGLNPDEVPLRHVLAYMEHMEDLLKRDHENTKSAFAEPLFEALRRVLS